jgi:hypothetical protein
MTTNEKWIARWAVLIGVALGALIMYGVLHLVGRLLYS